jgi:hypothetical protein
MQCTDNNPEVKTQVSCIKTRSQYRASQQSHCEMKTEHHSPAASRQASRKSSKNASKATLKQDVDLSQESIAEILGDKKAEVEFCSIIAQGRITEVNANSSEVPEEKTAEEVANADPSEELPSNQTVTQKANSPVQSCSSSKKRTLTEISGGPAQVEEISEKVFIRNDGSRVSSKKLSKISDHEVHEEIAEVTVDAEAKEASLIDSDVVSAEAAIQVPDVAVVTEAIAREVPVETAVLGLPEAVVEQEIAEPAFTNEISNEPAAEMPASDELVVSDVKADITTE